MTDEQIEQLKAVLDDGNNGSLYWMPDHNTAHKVTHIGEAPPPKEGDEPEPSEVAYVIAGIGNPYVALYNCDICEFKLVRPVTDLFE